jgi:hypothetical protein
LWLAAFASMSKRRSLHFGLLGGPHIFIFEKGVEK